MTRSTLFRIVRYALLATVAVVVGGFGFLYAAVSGSSKGSPKLAEEWRADLRKFADPDDPKVRDWRTFVIRFKSDEWVIARMQPSHGIWYRGGGTVVVKDSNGDVRAFFGHVCGSSPNPSSLLSPRLRNDDMEESLEDFYKHLGSSIYREHHFE